MEKLSAKSVADATGGRIIKGEAGLEACGVSIDSRTAGEGDVFFALKGAKADAHDFVGGAYDNGCRMIVISREEAAKLVPDDACVILTGDTLIALQELSHWYISRFDMKKVAVTGSVGKTTTRDMIYAILRRKYITGASKANLNSESGMPLALLGFTHEMQAAVIEMGMDGAGQIRRLAEIAGPDMAVITNIGISHIEILGSRENIFKAKMEIAERFSEENTLVINSDDDYLATLKEEELPYRIVRAGTGSTADFRATDIEDLGDRGVRFSLITPEGTMPIRLAVPGSHNAVNAALAAACCFVLGVPVEDISSGFAHTEMTGNRLRIKAAGDVKLIDDTYNASPESMKSAITTLAKSEGMRKVAVLGAMNELGELSDESHDDVGRFAAEAGIELLVTIGEKGARIGDAAKRERAEIEVRCFESKESVYPLIRDIFKEGDTILIKASRTIELELLAERIEEAFAGKGK